VECGVKGHFVPIISTFTKKGDRFYLPNHIDNVGTGVLDGQNYNLLFTLYNSVISAEYIFIFTNA